MSRPDSSFAAPPATLLLVLLAVTSPAAAEDPPSQTRIAELERRVGELEAENQETASRHTGSEVARWLEHVRIGGSANTGYYDGQKNSVTADDNFLVWDARFFVDVELGQEVRLFEITLVRNVGFSFEWNLVRLGSLKNDVGELYIDFQGIANTGWVNLQLGRFQVPVGENYLRFSQGYYENPFITNAVGGAWFWDEGVKLYGGDSSGLFSYVASISSGETAFNSAVSDHKQYTLKLALDPLDWLHLSASGLYSGVIGSASNRGSGGALWLGESWAGAFGSGTIVPNYVSGSVVPDGPNRIDGTWFVGLDAIVDLPNVLRLWLSYGHYDIDQAGELYDRQLHTWIVELILHGSLLTPYLKPVYLGLRANGLGTYDSDRGYLLDFRSAFDLGYNTKSIDDYSIVLGWHMLRSVTLRTEYTHRVVDVVRGVDASIRSQSQHTDAWGVEIGIHF
jgi:hypothetical protein